MKVVDGLINLWAVKDAPPISAKYVRAINEYAAAQEPWYVSTRGWRTVWWKGWLMRHGFRYSRYRGCYVKDESDNGGPMHEEEARWYCDMVRQEVDGDFWVFLRQGVFVEPIPAHSPSLQGVLDAHAPRSHGNQIGAAGVAHDPAVRPADGAAELAPGSSGADPSGTS